ncbi:hypothetical protein, partial [Pelomonas sp. KK5]|uniref:hypothetical protein n=1 Tax=Pelomonas sp. KK5 TaxID=1855730 RepID=UPI001E503214
RRRRSSRQPARRRRRKAGRLAGRADGRVDGSEVGKDGRQASTRRPTSTKAGIDRTRGLAASDMALFPNQEQCFAR